MKFLIFLVCCVLVCLHFSTTDAQKVPNSQDVKPKRPVKMVKGKCAGVKMVKDIDPSKMIGKWFTIYDFGPSEDECKTFEFEQLSSNQFIGHILHKNASFVITAKDSNDHNGLWSANSKFNKDIHGTNFQVIDTDYENYAGIFTCKEFEDVYVPAYFFWSRTHEMSQDSFEKLIAAASKYNDFDVTFKRTLDHSKCPSY